MVKFESFNLTTTKDRKYVNIGAIKLNLLGYDGMAFFQPNSSLYVDQEGNERTLEEMEYILDSILNILFDEYPNSTFYLQNITEILWIPYMKEKGIINYLQNKFKDRKLIFSDGNLHNSLPDIGFEWDSKCVFFGGSSYVNNQFNNEDIIDGRKFTRHFTCLQQRKTKSRSEMYQFLYNNNLLYKTFYTYVLNKLDPFFYTEDDGTNFAYTDMESEECDTINEKPVLFYPNKFYKSAFCNIVMESSFYKEDLPDTTYPRIFFTEKIEKCFTARQPFIMVGNRNSIAKLHELGFKTFGDWWDESYDGMDDASRMITIQNIIKEISSWSLQKCEQVWREMEDVLDYNQKLNTKRGLELKKFEIDFDSKIEAEVATETGKLVKMIHK